MADSFALELPGGLGWVIGPPADLDGGGYVRTAQVSIRAGGLDAQAEVTLSDGPWDPAVSFAGLAADWRGWAGTRRWRALEGEMEIEASHDGGRVRVAVTVRHLGTTFAAGAWSARIEFGLEPGEQLAGVARELAAVLA